MSKRKYETHVLPKLNLVEAWARDGLVEKQIAHNLGIAVSTLNVYKNEHPELEEALARGKEVVDIEVENDLLKKCHGYNAKVKKTFKLREVEYDPDTGKRVREYERLVDGYDEVHVPADITAIMFWLANRMRGKWQYRPEGRREDSGETGVIEIGGQAAEPEPPADLVAQMMDEAVENHE